MVTPVRNVIKRRRKGRKRGRGEIWKEEEEDEEEECRVTLELWTADWKVYTADEMGK